MKIKFDKDHIDKFNKARLFLLLSGYISDSENEKIIARLQKAANKAGVELKRTLIVGGSW